MSFQDPSDEALRLAQAGSGLAWAVVFYISGFILVQLIAWAILPLTRDRLLLAALPLFLASLPLNLLLPRPAGTGRCSGVGIHFDRPAITNAVVGLGLSAAVAALVIGLQLALGVIRIEPATPGDAFLVSRAGAAFVALQFMLAAAGEELAFRGYGFQQLARALTPAGAAVATALFFGFVHGSNPSVTELGVANTVVFGLVFGFALVWSRSWWLPFGLHLGWNLTLAYLGAGISGITMEVAWQKVVVDDHGVISGGEYGPEGSVLTTFFAAALAVIVWRTSRSRPQRLLWDESTVLAPSSDQGG